MSIQVRALPPGGDPLILVQRWPERYPYLLQSVAQGTPQSRHDIVFLAGDEELVLSPTGSLTGPHAGAAGGDFLTALDRWWRSLGPVSDSTDLPFRGGWFVYLGYELAGQVESRLRLPRDRDGLPTAWARRCPAAIVVDRATGQAAAVAEPEHAHRLDDLEADWRCASPACALPRVVPSRVREEPPSRFRQALSAIHDYILAGDVFQVNISRRWDLDGRVDPVAAYAALRRHNPAPFAAFARRGDSAVVSSSPERLVHSARGWVQTRPIAGTRPREGASDALRRRELIGHPKERAEHIMLIDLERNDLGRVCQPGTVSVDELMAVETYAHVHHIVSNVRGRLRPDVAPGEVVRAVFPGGTITGCPKVRCMEIIAELEAEGRGAYTGSLGYLGRDGSMDFNILIRTLVVTPDGIGFRAGAGIVADSEVERELEETRSKAKGLLLALGVDGSAARSHAR